MAALGGWREAAANLTRMLREERLAARRAKRLQSKYRHITQAEREQIYHLRTVKGLPLRQIARLVGHDHHTVARALQVPINYRPPKPVRLRGRRGRFVSFPPAQPVAPRTPSLTEQLWAMPLDQFVAQFRVFADVADIRLASYRSAALPTPQPEAGSPTLPLRADGTGGAPREKDF